MKEFWLTDKGEIGRHKGQKANIIGHGLIHPNQLIVAYTNRNRKLSLHYGGVKVGTHFLTSVFLMQHKDELLTRIDIITIGENYEV